MATQGKTIAETPHVCRVCFAPGHANYTCDLRLVVENERIWGNWQCMHWFDSIR